MTDSNINKKHLLRKIHLQINHWYVLILLIVLIPFSYILYRDLSTSLYSNIDSILISKTNTIINSLNTNWTSEQASFKQDGLPTLSKVNHPAFNLLAKEWVLHNLDNPNLIDVVVQIFDANGQHIVSSKEIPEIRIFPSKLLHTKIENKQYFINTVSIKPAKAGSFRVRILSVPELENGNIAYIIQVVRSLEVIDTILNKIQVIFLLFILITIIIVSIAGSFVVKITLRPIEKITRTLQELSAKNIKTPIMIDGSGDEIKHLSETFYKTLAELDQTFSSQKRFIQDASHELRTPLTILKGEIEVTLKKERSGNEYQSVLMSSLEEINNMIVIIENLLILVKFESSEMNLNPADVNISLLLEYIVKHVKILADMKKTEIHFSCSHSSLIIEGDESHLKRLFLNLIENAIKYTPDFGKVLISATEDQGQIKIVINDNGMGILEKDIPFIFDRFYRPKESRSRSGSGLGLSIVKSILSSHNGTIKVESIPACGTTFTIFLPIKSAN
ncbi:MAG: hypothetical protein A2Y40_07430 [Candidatus Margulisbacteria bacterium GWF2_35_9]|nr:MAG: hypothetical protein A2Y40_07430 [Candidatus Margulisbacteria bacterium GWF2_35_9]